MPRTRMLALSAGIGLGALVPLGPGSVGSWVLVPGLLGLWLCRDRSRLTASHPATGQLLCLLCCVALGSAYALWRGSLHAERLLPVAWEGHDLWVRGVVTGLPRERERYRRIDLRVRSSCLQLLPEQCRGREAGFAPRLIRLSVYDPSLHLQPGDEWWLRVRLRRPRGTVNPGITDPETRWFRQGLAATGYVRETAFNQATGRVHPSVDRWRHVLLERIRLPDEYRGQQGMVDALVAGHADGISDGQWQLLNGTGTSHLVVISGLHIGLVAWAAYGLAGRLVRYLPGLLLLCPAPVWAAGAAMVAATGYAALAGFSLPTRRALIMLLVLLAGRLSGRRFPVSLGYCVALTLVLLLDPLAVGSAGFWYSFTAVGVLLLTLAAPHSGPFDAGGPVARAWSRWGRSQWVVFVGLLVPMMIWHGTVSPVAPLANLLAVPFVSLVIVPLCLTGALVATVFPGASLLLLTPAAQCLQWLEQGLQSLRDNAGDLAQVTLPLLPPLAVVCTVLALLLLLMPRGWPLRYIAIPLLLPLIAPYQEAGTPRTAHVLVADVGQGLGVVIRTADDVVVYDTGPGPGLMGRVVARQLRRSGEPRINTLIVSHDHDDHAGGLAGLRNQWPVGRWLSGSPERFSGFQGCRAGQRWRLNGVEFRILHPLDRAGAAAGTDNENNRSCVLQLRAGNDTLLLAGDIEAGVERRLVERYGSALQSDVLLMPHHGSATSSSAPFLEAVRPSLAIHSASYNSRFGHPDEAVLSRYRQRGIRTLGTARSGAIRLCLGPDCPEDPVTRRYRAERPRYWRQP